jgi:hypothetical protein
MSTPFIFGLDLGQSSDPTALAALRQITHATDGTILPFPEYHVVNLHRWKLGTPYPDMVVDVAVMLDRPEFRGYRLAVDYTGVGRPVVDMFRRHSAMPVRIVPISITAGERWTWDKATQAYHVPKRELVSVLQVLLQKERLKIARAIPDAAVMAKELQNFKVKITASANETFGAWRDGQHDDIVLAVAMACWLGERTGAGKASDITVGPPVLVEDAGEGVFGSGISGSGAGSRWSIPPSERRDRE